MLLSIWVRILNGLFDALFGFVQTETRTDIVHCSPVTPPDQVTHGNSQTTGSRDLNEFDSPLEFGVDPTVPTRNINHTSSCTLPLPLHRIGNRAAATTTRALVGNGAVRRKDFSAENFTQPQILDTSQWYETTSFATGVTTKAGDDGSFCGARLQNGWLCLALA